MNTRMTTNATHERSSPLRGAYSVGVVSLAVLILLAIQVFLEYDDGEPDAEDHVHWDYTDVFMTGKPTSFVWRLARIVSTSVRVCSSADCGG